MARFCFPEVPFPTTRFCEFVLRHGQGIMSGELPVNLSACVFSQIRRHWGGQLMGNKSVARIAKLEKIKARDAAQKANL